MPVQDPRAAELKPKSIDMGRPTEKEHREEETEGGVSKRSASLDDGNLSKILAGVASIDLGPEDDEAVPIDQHREGRYDAAGEAHEGKSGTAPDGDSGDSSQQPPQRSKKNDKFTSVDSSALGFTAQRPQYQQPLGRQVSPFRTIPPPQPSHYYRQVDASGVHQPRRTGWKGWRIDFQVPGSTIRQHQTD